MSRGAGLYPRRCTACGVPKAAVDFWPNGLKRKAHCKPCAMRDVDEWRRAHPDRALRSKRNGAQARRDAEPAALRGGLEWTGAELEIAMRPGLSLSAAAKALGRSVAAVSNMRQRCRKDPRYARLAGIDSPLADLAEPGTINVAPRYDRANRLDHS